MKTTDLSNKVFAAKSAIGTLPIFGQSGTMVFGPDDSHGIFSASRTVFRIPPAVGFESIIHKILDKRHRVMKYDSNKSKYKSVCHETFLRKFINDFFNHFHAFLFLFLQYHNNRNFGEVNISRLPHWKS